MNTKLTRSMLDRRRTFSRWRPLCVTFALAWSAHVSAGYEAALEAYRQGKYDVMTAEIRSADPKADKQGLRALVRAIDKDQMTPPTPEKPQPSNRIPNRKEIAELLDRAAEAAGDGESIYRLDHFAPRPSADHPNRPIILRYKKAAELGYAQAQYRFALISPWPNDRERAGRTPDLVIGEREGMNWIRQAAEGGAIEAQLFMAELVTGRWIKYNITDPDLQHELRMSLSPTYWISWMEKAGTNEQFESGLSRPSVLASARYQLAWAYSRGAYGAPLDLARAYKFAKLADAAGDRAARIILDDIREKGYQPANDFLGEDAKSERRQRAPVENYSK